MGSMSGAVGAGSRRGSTRRGSRGGEQQQQHQQTTNPSTSNNTGGRYVSVSVRILDGEPSCWTEAWRWMESYCRPGWAPWILAAVLVITFAAASLVNWLRLCAQLCSLVVPFLALISGYLLLALSFRHSWTPTGIYLTFCGSVVGETVGFFLSTALVDNSSPLRSYRQQVTRQPYHLTSFPNFKKGHTPFGWAR